MEVSNGLTLGNEGERHPLPLEAHQIEESASAEAGVCEPRPARPRLTIHLGLFALLLALSMPQLLKSYSLTQDPLDTSWTWMMAYALQHHLQWGKSIIFTYGPLGFLADTYFYSDHLLWALSATARLTSWLVFGLGFAYLLRRLAPDSQPPRRTTLPIAIGWIFGACFLSLSDQSAVLGVLLLVLAIAEERRALVNFELALSGSLLALGALIKSTGLIVSLFGLLVYPALWWYARGRRSALRLSLIPLLSFAVSFCALWLCSSQSFTNLPAYFHGTWAIVSGYTPAMGTPDMPFPILKVQIRSALLILALLAAVLIGVCLRGTRVRVAQYLLLAGMAFWAWKEGFTLQDTAYVRHPTMFYGTALLIASVGTVLRSNETPRYLRNCLYGAYAVALLSSLVGYPPPESMSYRNMPGNYESYFGLMSSESRRAAEEHIQTAAIQKLFRVPAPVLDAVGSASVNVMPWSLMLAQGYGLRLVAAPVIQTYSAYTPYLDQLNARQIWDGRGADKIIFSYASLGYRYVPFSEPATFRAIMHCYRPEYSGGTYAVLSRLGCTPPDMVAAGGPKEGAFGKWISVPPLASHVEIDLHPDALGTVEDILHKADHVWILFGLPNGLTAGPFEFIYPVAKDGLYIRYFIRSQSDFEQLLAGNSSGLQRIAAFQIVEDHGPMDFPQHFGIRFLSDGPPR